MDSGRADELTTTEVYTLVRMSGRFHFFLPFRWPSDGIFDEPVRLTGKVTPIGHLLLQGVQQVLLLPKTENRHAFFLGMNVLPSRQQNTRRRGEREQQCSENM